MEFGEVPLDRALSAILAHSVALPDGRLRKGKRLQPADLDRLAAAGIGSVTVARLAPTDVDEDAAALAIAQALVPDPAAAGLDLRAVGTGRVNLHAAGPGILRVDAAAIHALNATDPMITVATAPEWQRMDRGGMVATVKIIAYAVDGPALSAACRAGGAALSLLPPRRRRIALIQTRVDPREDGAKGLAAIALRTARLAAKITQTDLVGHRIADLAAAITAIRDCDLILILTGSATSDPRDVAPEALRVAGGQVDHFGMPVDPGNLLFLGALGAVPVIGLPGCARSPALNGADWVMERLICGQPVTAADIQGMGVGGLLKEIPTRPRPRDPAARRPPADPGPVSESDPDLPGT
ncbi:molybdopterin-binding protein [Szabonella alba]|uniref:Molybdopterin-binding protein n=1 Tax=Szabonella alba TaxID=2804194 RepID=A0A8K0V8I1_9RHOB|nr:molybdopterin-binding protein [Szabonella alba]MBL4916251.1 molybdopterin-binding protein [Szabonella alba]